MSVSGYNYHNIKPIFIILANTSVAINNVMQNEIWLIQSIYKRITYLKTYSTNLDVAYSKPYLNVSPKESSCLIDFIKGTDSGPLFHIG